MNFIYSLFLILIINNVYAKTCFEMIEEINQLRRDVTIQRRVLEGGERPLPLSAEQVNLFISQLDPNKHRDFLADLDYFFTDLNALRFKDVYTLYFEQDPERVKWILSKIKSLLKKVDELKSQGLVNNEMFENILNIILVKNINWFGREADYNQKVASLVLSLKYDGRLPDIKQTTELFPLSSKIMIKRKIAQPSFSEDLGEFMDYLYIKSFSDFEIVSKELERLKDATWDSYRQVTLLDPYHISIIKEFLLNLASTNMPKSKLNILEDTIRVQVF